MVEDITFVGLDVSKDVIAVGVAPGETLVKIVDDLRAAGLPE